MNLAQYTQMPKGSKGEFIKWTQNGEVKVLRFLYTSKDGSDIPVVKKAWDDEQKKYVYDTPDGKLTCTLQAILYEKGKEPQIVRWERSAAFTSQVCTGYWSKFPRIVDGVWEVTCTNPGTKEIKFSWFPVMDADFTTYPLPQGVEIKNGKVAISGSESNDDSSKSVDEPEAPPPKKYWE